MKRKENGRRGKPNPGRRVPPPDQTFKEGRYIRELKEAESIIEVTLTNGDTFRGSITYFDSAMIKIAPDHGPTVFVRKADIRTIAETG